MSIVALDTVNHLGVQKMKSLKILKISVAALALTMDLSSAFAQARTREEVQKELRQSENDGARVVTDASYRDTSPMHQQQIAQRKAQLSNGDEGVGTSGSSESGDRVEKPRPCVGPVSYCNLYFGG
jgi:Domain of unknown function (DUF4148)